MSVWPADEPDPWELGAPKNDVDEMRGPHGESADEWETRLREDWEATLADREHDEAQSSDRDPPADDVEWMYEWDTIL